MARIQQLPHAVVTKIAAGEVIERPASVVKELLENSIDAESTRIDLEVEQGGIELIRVVDNGSGIPPEDLPLAFASHATSKLSTADDLFRIATLGFRGEALASIGGVAQVTLQSRRDADRWGAAVTCHGGELSSPQPWNGSAGTRLEVRHLFFNTPVRRKFMRAPATEMAHVSEQFTRLALSHIPIHWSLRHNDKAIYDLPAELPLLDRIRLFYGQEVSDALLKVEAAQGPILLRGFVADPACDRGTAKMQYFFLNGRWIRDRTLTHALQEAYRGLLMTGRYAVAFLFLDLPADHVDVNVHPTKSEVRFRDGNALHHLVHGAVRDRLREANLTARLQIRPSSLGITPALKGEIRESLWAEPRREPHPQPEFMPASPPSNGHSIPPPVAAKQIPRPIAPESALPPEAAPRVSSTNGFVAGEFKAIQLYDTYLVLETAEGMLVIDQHALHERILFEGLKKRIRSGPLETQKLLIPEPVELASEAAAKVLEHREALTQLGLELSDFGGGTVLLAGVPALLSRRSPRGILQAVVDYLVTKERLPTSEVLLNNLLSLMACHAAVRAGDRLTGEEIEALIAQRELADDAHHCPHGRPTALLFSRHDLERQFRRI